MSDNTPDTPDLADEYLAELKPRQLTVRVLLDQSLLTRHAELQARLEREMAIDERENRTPVAPEVAREIVALEAEIDEAKRPFTFEGIGHRAWSDLLAEHPPVDGQGSGEFGPGFPAEAVAASCVKPALSIEQATKFDVQLPDIEWNKLWNAAIQVNVGGGDSPKDEVAGLILRMSGRSGDSATNAASPVPSS